jgi:hypothetical protein
VAEGADAQACQPREPPDRDELVHGGHREPSGRSRVKGLDRTGRATAQHCGL